jgi:hypothetical protein
MSAPLTPMSRVVAMTTMSTASAGLSTRFFDRHPSGRRVRMPGTGNDRVSKK